MPAWPRYHTNLVSPRQTAALRPGWPDCTAGSEGAPDSAMTVSMSEGICVLGMHRSGTSLVTRALSVLGAYLGPEGHMMKPREDNPLGFCEHQSLTDLNEEILCELGGGWHTPPSFPPGWEFDPRLDRQRARARQILREDFGAATLWAWKDPRTCLTLPFWQSLAPGLRYVVCVRSPLDVARSLAKRDGFSIERGGSLWLEHMSRAIAYTSGYQRLFVSYDDLVERQPTEMDRLASFIGRPESVAEGLPPIRDYTDATLRHHQTRIEAVMEDPELPFPARALYLSLLLVTDLQHRKPDARSRTSGMFEAALDHFSSEAGRAQADARERDALELRLRAQLRELTAVVQEKSASIEATQHVLSARERERDDQRALIALLHEDLGATKEYARTLEVDRDALRGDRDAISRERDGFREHASALRDALDESTRRVAYLESPGGSLKAGLRALLPHRVYVGLRRVYERRPVWRR